MLLKGYWFLVIEYSGLPNGDNSFITAAFIYSLNVPLCIEVNCLWPLLFLEVSRHVEWPLTFLSYVMVPAGIRY